MVVPETVIRKQSIMSDVYNPFPNTDNVLPKKLSASATRDERNVFTSNSGNFMSGAHSTRKQTIFKFKLIRFVYVFLQFMCLILQANSAVPIEGSFFDERHGYNIIPYYFLWNRHLLLVTEVNDQQRETLLFHVHTQNNNAYDDMDNLYSGNDTENEYTVGEVYLPPLGNSTNDEDPFGDIQGGYDNNTTEHHFAALHEHDTVGQDTSNNYEYVHQTVEQPYVIVCHPTEETNATVHVTVSNINNNSLIVRHQMGELFLVTSADGRNQIRDDPGENHGQLQLVYHPSEEINGPAQIHHQILVSAHDTYVSLLGLNEVVELAISTALVAEATSTSEYMETNIIPPHSNHEGYDLGNGQYFQIAVSDHHTGTNAQFQQDYGVFTATQQCPVPRVLVRQYEEERVTGGMGTESNGELHLFRERSNSSPPTNIQQSGNDTDMEKYFNDT